MKIQTKLVKALKGKIASIINLVKLGVKKYIIKLMDLEQALESAIAAQFKKTIRVQIKTGHQNIRGEVRGANVFIDGVPIAKVFKPESEIVEVKKNQGKWIVSEYEIPFGSLVQFFAHARGQSQQVDYRFVAGSHHETVDVNGYSYAGEVCGWIVEIG